MTRIGTAPRRSRSRSGWPRSCVADRDPVPLAIVISIAFAAGVVTVLNDDSAVDRIEQQVDQMRDQLPDHVEVPQP